VTDELLRASAAEAAALVGGVALDRAPDVALLDLEGTDRVRFLQNLASADVGSLSEGATTRGFVTHQKGGIVSGFEVVALAESLRLRLPADRLDAVRTHLERYRVMERVELVRRPERAAWRLEGPGAAALVVRAGLDLPDSGATLDATLGGVSVRLGALDRSGRVEVSVELDAASTEAVAGALTDAAGGTLVELDAAGRALARVLAGRAAWGIDVDESTFPQETGDLAAISFTKGCYLGQEVVARIHYRGGVQRRLCRLAFEAEPTPGEELLVDGRPVGGATTVVHDGARDAWVGLGLVHRRGLEPGVRVSARGGSAVEATPLGA